MKSTIASETLEGQFNRILTDYGSQSVVEWEQKYHTRTLAQSLVEAVALDHIASVARQEGREEMLEQIREEVEFFKVDYTDPDGSYPIVSVKSIDYILAKLTGKEEGKA